MAGKHPEMEAGLKNQLSLYKCLRRPQRAQNSEREGRVRHTDTHAQAGVPVRTHLGGRLSEQRSVVQATGAVGPGGEVLHFGVSSLSPSHSKLASIPSRSLKSGAPHAAWSPGTHSSCTRASGKSGRRRWVGAQTRGIRPLRLSPALLLILSSCLRK